MAIDWNDISVRERRNSKGVRLKVTALRGIEVFVPKGFGRRKVRDVIQKNDAWLKKKVAEVEKKSRHLAPDEISLQATGGRWTVEYLGGKKPETPLCQENDGSLTLQPDKLDFRSVVDILRQWLTFQARSKLVPWLEQISVELSLPFSKATVRGQKTRWASCSTSGTISINRNLLFLPPPSVRYVFVHELCHTLKMDHSEAFWQLVEDREPGYRDIRSRVRKSWQDIPAWASPDI